VFSGTYIKVNLLHLLDFASADDYKFVW